MLAVLALPPLDHICWPTFPGVRVVAATPKIGHAKTHAPRGISLGVVFGNELWADPHFVAPPTAQQRESVTQDKLQKMQDDQFVAPFWQVPGSDEPNMEVTVEEVKVGHPKNKSTVRVPIMVNTVAIKKGDFLSCEVPSEQPAKRQK